MIPREDAENLVGALPSEGDHLVTQDFLRAELADCKTELMAEMEDKFATKDFLHAELAESKTELMAEMEDKFATKDFVRAEIGGLRGEMYKAILAALPIGMGVAVGVAKLVG